MRNDTQTNCKRSFDEVDPVGQKRRGRAAVSTQLNKLWGAGAVGSVAHPCVRGILILEALTILRKKQCDTLNSNEEKL